MLFELASILARISAIFPELAIKHQRKFQRHAWTGRVFDFGCVRSFGAFHIHDIMFASPWPRVAHSDVIVQDFRVVQP